MSQPVSRSFGDIHNPGYDMWVADRAKRRYNEYVSETRTQPATVAAVTSCGWMFHGVTRHDNGDGTVTLPLGGWRLHQQRRTRPWRQLDLPVVPPARHPQEP